MASKADVRDFANQKFTVTTYENEKIGQTSAIQIDGKDR